MAKNANEFSAEAVMAFLDWAAKSGKIKSSTAYAMKATSKKFFDTLNEHEKNDLSKLNIDELLNRFESLHAQDMSAVSLKTYRSRTKKALDEFFAYVKNPGGWKPSFKQRKKRAKRDIEKPVAAKAPRKAKTAAPRKGRRPAQRPVEPVRAVVVSDEPSLTHQYPLRSDITVKISGLPRDLKVAEAQRLSAFLATLCEDYAPGR